MADLSSMMLPPRSEIEKRTITSRAGGGTARALIPILTSLLGTPLGPLGIIGGGVLGAGALHLLGNRREPEETLTGAIGREALFGAAGFGAGKLASPIIGAALKKAAPKIAVEGGGKLGKVGTSVRQNVFRPDVSKGALYESKVDELSALQKTLGLKGGPRGQSKQIAQIAKDLDKKVKAVVTLNDNPIPQNDLANKYFAELGKPGRTFGLSDKSYSNAAAELLDDLGKVKTVGDAYRLKGSLDLANIYTKLDKGTGLTRTEEATRALHATLSDMIEEFGDDSIKVLNRQQNQLNPLARGAQKEAEKTMSLPLVGSAGSGIKGGVKAGQDILGRGLQTLGEGGQIPFARQAMPVIGGALGAGIGALPPGEQPQEQTTTEAEQPILSPKGQWRWDKQASKWIPNTDLAGINQGKSAILGGGDTNDISKMLTMAMLQDLKTGGKNVTELKTVLDAFKELGGGGLDVNSKKKLNQLDQAEIIVNSFAERALALKPSESAPLARLRGLATSVGTPIGLNSPEARAFKENRKGMRVLLARSLGEVGNLSETEQKAALDMIPDIGDSQEEVILKTQGLVSILNSLKESIRTPNNSQ